MWIKLTHTTLTGMESRLEATPIARWSTLDEAERFYDGQEGTYSGYIHPNPPNAFSTPVVVLKLN